MISKAVNHWPFVESRGDEFAECVLKECGKVTSHWWRSELTGAVLCDACFQKNRIKRK